jgi:hypothetical protein
MHFTNIMEIDVVMFSCGSGQLVGVQAYPVEEGDRLLDGHSMRTRFGSVRQYH